VTLSLSKNTFAQAASGCQRKVVLDMVADLRSLPGAPKRKDPPRAIRALTNGGKEVQRRKDEALTAIGLIKNLPPEGASVSLKRKVLEQAPPGSWLSEHEFSLNEQGTNLLLSVLRLDKSKLDLGGHVLEVTNFRPDYIVVGWTGIDTEDDRSNPARSVLVLDAEGISFESAGDRTILRVIDAKTAAIATSHQRTEVALYSVALACWLAQTGLDDRFAVSASPSVYPGIFVHRSHDTLAPVLRAERLVPSDLPLLLDEAAEVIRDALGRFAKGGHTACELVMSQACQACAYLDEGEGSCLGVARSQDHLALAGIRTSAAKALSLEGVETLSDLAGLRPEDIPYDGATQASWPSERARAVHEQCLVRLGNTRSVSLPGGGDVDIVLSIEWDVHADLCLGIGVQIWMHFDDGPGKRTHEQREQTFLLTERERESERAMIGKALGFCARAIEYYREQTAESPTISILLWDETERAWLSSMLSRLPYNPGKDEKKTWLPLIWLPLICALWSPIAVGVVRSALLDTYALPWSDMPLSQISRLIKAGDDDKNRRLYPDHSGPGLAWMLFPEEERSEQAAATIEIALQTRASQVGDVAQFLRRNHCAAFSAPHLDSYRPQPLPPSAFGRLSWCLRRASLDADQVEVVRGWCLPAVKRFGDGLFAKASVAEDPETGSLICRIDDDTPWHPKVNESVVLCPRGDTSWLFGFSDIRGEKRRNCEIATVEVRNLRDGTLGATVPPRLRSVFSGITSCTLERPRSSVKPAELMKPLAESFSSLGRRTTVPLVPSLGSGSTGSQGGVVESVEQMSLCTGVGYDPGAQSNRSIAHLVVFDPATAAGIPTGLETRLRSLDDLGESDLNESQREAIIGLLSRHLGLLWGPPGTGKSHTLAWLLRTWFALVKAPAAIVCPTYAALDSLIGHVEKAGAADLVVRVRSTSAPAVGSFSSRVLDITSAALQARDVVDRISAAYRSGDRVVFATLPYQAGKVAKAGYRASLVVLDEASQVRIGETAAALAIATMDRVAVESPDGTVVVAGDPKQLSPVMPVMPTGEAAGAARSLWDHIRAGMQASLPLIGGSPVEPFVLSVNYRSDEGIVSALREMGYPLSYQAAGPKDIPPACSDDPFVNALVAQGNGRLRVVEIRNDKLEGSSDGEGSAEAAIAEAVVLAFWNARGDMSLEQFFTERIGVVCAHRSQRRRIIRTVAAALGVSPAEVEALRGVDTAERFQGGERDVIVVSYGVSSEDTVSSQEDFLYNPCRSIVALSRARALSLVLISSAMLHRRLASPELREARTLLSVLHKNIWSESSGGAL